MEPGLTEYLGVVGRGISAEDAATLKVSLTALARTVDAPITLWGRIEGYEGDYYVAQTDLAATSPAGPFASALVTSTATEEGAAPVKAVAAPRTFISADGGARWTPLDMTVTEEQLEFCEELRDPFMGRPDFEYKVRRLLPEVPDVPQVLPIVPEEDEETAEDAAAAADEAEGEEGEEAGEEEQEDEAPKKPKKKKPQYRILAMKETVRLAHFVAAHDAQCRLVPRGAYVSRDGGVTVTRSATFDGLTHEQCTKLGQYLHAGGAALTFDRAQRAQIVEHNKTLYGAHFHAPFDFLPSAAEDMPHGVWSVKYNPTLDVAVVKNLLFRGSTFFYKPGTQRYWQIYLGNGLRALDLAFILP